MAEDVESGRDDGRAWGHIINGRWRALPKVPLLGALLGPPPFDVALPDGQIRRVVHNPAEVVTNSARPCWRLPSRRRFVPAGRRLVLPRN